ncbi:OsmC family protein [Massilia niastensis]|uniref:OsmC family protein n=1 Tax=Massilia niastensis TaxID=544911 RepID=UPI00036120E8|nr:OsmC family protein [Massilia niastensis]
MKQFDARVAWQRAGQPFLDQRYSRAHAWSFDGGLQVPASSSPLSVPVPMSDPAAVDPEEALVAAASSCHMLFFLSIAAQRGFVVDSYDDRALGLLDQDAGGRAALVRIELRPAIVFGGERRPEAADIAQIHHLAHEKCYVANSLKAEVVVMEAR